MFFFVKNKKRIKKNLKRLTKLKSYFISVIKKITSFSEKVEEKVPINYVDTFYFEEDSLCFEGSFDSKLEKEKLKILVKLRGKELFYKYPLLKMEKSRWKTEIKISDRENLFSKGIWDFYILEENNDLKYRIRVKNNNLFNKRAIFYHGTEKSSQLLKFYITKKLGLSFTSKAYLINAKVTEVQKDDWNITIKGRFFWENKYIQEEHFKEAKISLRQRDTGSWFEYPIQIVCDNESCKKKFMFKINYKDFIPQDEFKTLRWDAYLDLNIDKNTHKFRIHLKSDRFLKDSRFQFENPEINQIYFYSTVANNLSLVLTKLNIERDIFEKRLFKGSLRLKGYMYLDIFDFTQDFVQNRVIVIRERNSGEEIKIPLIDISFKRKEHQEFHDFFQRHSSFDIKIPLKHLITLIQDKKTILDLYCRILYKGRIYERKLGCSDYDYYKDYPLSSGLVESNNFFYRHFLTFTPRGNLKIEVTRYSQEDYKYIKYGQYLDWIRNIRKDLWLIGERPDTAQDTGYHFFKYCRKNYPEKEIYYVIDSSSKDIKNIEGLGNVLFLGSEEHLKKAAIAKVFIGSHDLEYFLPTKPFELFSYKKGKRIFLQHGVLGRKNVEYHKKYYIYPFHKFCVSSQMEKQMVMKKMGYKSKEVVVTGLSRFDNLLNKSKSPSPILLIPTWREWINSEEAFIESDYFKRYKALLTNERLISLLKEYGVKLKFYPHYRMQPFIELFGEFNKEYINVVKLGDLPVQQLLLESSLMITDYSSVSFDFNYMSKPIIFFHFDQDRFFANGILRPIGETFLGDICKTEEEVIKSIEYYLKHGFTEKESITEKKHLIFDYIDQKNCERIFNEITMKKIRKI